MWFLRLVLFLDENSLPQSEHLKSLLLFRSLSLTIFELMSSCNFLNESDLSGMDSLSSLFEEKDASKSLFSSFIFLEDFESLGSSGMSLFCSFLDAENHEFWDQAWPIYLKVLKRTTTRKSASTSLYRSPTSSMT